MKPTAITLAVCLSLSAAAVAKERAEISVPYRITPSRPLPRGLEAVAVAPAEVRADEADAARREEKWAAYAADIIDEMLTEAAFEAGPDSPALKVRSRRELVDVLKEHDLAAAGVVDSQNAQRLGQLLSVQGLILSRIHIDITEEETQSRKADWSRILTGIAGANRGSPDGYARRPFLERMYGGRGGAYGGDFSEDEVTEISRHLSVRCSFQLIDVVTGDKLVVHNPPPYRKTDSTSPVFFFGRAVGEAELNPLDVFIGELVEKASLEFVGKLVPVTLDTTVNVVGKGKNGEAGVRALQRGDAESARQLLKQAVIDDPDDHENIHALGVAFELLGRPENAIYCYRRAAAHDEANSKEVGQYMQDVARVEAYLAAMPDRGADEQSEADDSGAADDEPAEAADEGSDD